MPLLQPMNGNEQPDLKTIQSKLEKAIPEFSKRDAVCDLLERHGAGLEPTCATVANIMNFGTPDDQIRLRAAEISLKAHGAMTEDAKASPNFVFLIKGEVDINNILQPVRG